MILGSIPMSPDMIRAAKNRPTAFLLYHWLFFAGSTALVELGVLAVAPNVIVYPVPVALAFALATGLIMAAWQRRDAQRIARQQDAT